MLTTTVSASLSRTSLQCQIGLECNPHNSVSSNSPTMFCLHPLSLVGEKKVRRSPGLIYKTQMQHNKRFGSFFLNIKQSKVYLILLELQFMFLFQYKLQLHCLQDSVAGKFQYSELKLCPCLLSLKVSATPNSTHISKANSFPFRIVVLLDFKPYCLVKALTFRKILLPPF